MHKLGIHNGADLKKWDLPSLLRNFGKAGKFYYDIARGIDDRPVETDNERKSVGTGLTCEKDLSDFGTLHQAVTEIRKSIDLPGTKIRLPGVNISNLGSEDDEDRQLHLFDEDEG